MPIFHLLQSLQRVRADVRGVFDEVLALNDLQCRQRRGGRHRILLVCVVAERIGAGDVELDTREARRNRQHAAAQRFAEHQDVGRGAIVFGSEEAPRLAQAGGDFIEDEQRAAVIAGLAHRLPIARWRNEGHGARRLGDHRGDVAFALEHVAHHARATQFADLQVGLSVGVHRVAVRAAVAAEGRDMFGAGQQRAHRARAAKQRLAADAGRAEAGAVKRIPETEQLGAPRGNACEFDRHFHGVGPAGREQHLAWVSGQRLEASAECLCELHRAAAGKAARRKTQLIELLLDGANHVRMRISDVVHVVAMEIHIAPARHVFDEHALRFSNRAQARRRDRLVQERGAVAGEQGASRVVQVLALPLLAKRRVIHVPLALGRTQGHVHDVPRRDRIGQPRVRARAAMRSSGSTTTACCTASNSGRSLMESL